MFQFLIFSFKQVKNQEMYCNKNSVQNKAKIKKELNITPLDDFLSFFIKSD
ncbi:hypothetical protein MARTH_orf259 [Metamycoplasma arthritidis 158L3-1]|uniref:Uncharacterized protein n=1 Tax=Metamycoplasma arthritidis (strain 158L3-1) TaxID=243272 RepID=B3PMB1_META1|nr:hypothetical protein MARTH_orf259 [Metamycoplasma arthritidis 158L3-1]